MINIAYRVTNKQKDEISNEMQRDTRLKTENVIKHLKEEFLVKNEKIDSH